MAELQAETKSLENVPSYRACENCRLHKQRCIPDNASTSGKCQRCVRAGRACVFASRPDRKPRKRTDARVAELEREVRAMRALIRSQGSTEETTRDSDDQTASVSPANAEPVPSSMGAQRKTSPQLSAGMSDTFSSNPGPWEMENPAWPPSDSSKIKEMINPQGYWSSPLIPAGDAIDRGVVSQPVAEELMKIYVNDLYPNYPVVPLPNNMDLQELRLRKPHLLLAVIAAAAAKVDPRLYRVLNAEVLQAYAIKVVINTEKSLELVQAMIVTAVWYFPPDHFSRLKFYEYIHMAATMALDIGLGSKPMQSSELLDSDGLQTSNIESRRTFLACYLNCSGVSVSMRRPNMLRYNDWVEDCVRELENSPNVTQADLTIAAWTRLHRIAEEIAISLKYDDPAQAPMLDDARLKLLLTGFMRQLEAWESDAKPLLLQGSFAIMYYTVKIFLYEIFLYSDHSPGDFRPPHPTETLRVLRSNAYPAPTSEGLATIISSSQALLQIFINLKVEQVRSLPASTIVRVRYAAYILCKLFVSARDTTSLIGRLIDPESLNLDYFLRLTGAKLQAAAEPLGWNVPSLFLGLLKKFYSWYLQQTGQAINTDVSVGEPAQSFDQPLSQPGIQRTDPPSFAQMNQSLLSGQHLSAEGLNNNNYGDAMEDLNLYGDQQFPFDLDWEFDTL